MGAQLRVLVFLQTGPGAVDKNIGLKVQLFLNFCKLMMRPVKEKPLNRSEAFQVLM